MSLFLIFSMPLFCLFVAFLPWDPELVSRKLSLLSLFLRGLLLFIPGYLVLLIVRRIIGVAYVGFPLYLYLLLRDYMTPFLLGAGAFLLAQKKLTFPATSEGIFLVSFSFLCGFFALFGIADFLSLFRHWDAFDLFLLPLLRMTAVIALSLAAPGFYRWQGKAAVEFIGIAAAMGLFLALFAWLFRVNFGLLSIPLSMLAFLGSLAFFVWRFPRILRAGKTV